MMVLASVHYFHFDIRSTQCVCCKRGVVWPPLGRRWLSFKYKLPECIWKLICIKGASWYWRSICIGVDLACGGFCWANGAGEDVHVFHDHGCVWSSFELTVVGAAGGFTSGACHYFLIDYSFSLMERSSSSGIVTIEYGNYRCLYCCIHLLIHYNIIVLRSKMCSKRFCSLSIIEQATKRRKEIKIGYF